MRRLRALAMTLGEVAGWLHARGLGWLAPVVFVLLLLGGLLALSAAAPALSPFVYLLF